jgi:hypothetical protein
MHVEGGRGSLARRWPPETYFGRSYFFDGAQCPLDAFETQKGSTQRRACKIFGLLPSNELALAAQLHLEESNFKVVPSDDLLPLQLETEDEKQ